MKTKVFFGILLSLFVMQSAFSSGALRFILPYLTDIVGMKEGEIAYDSTRKAVVFKNNTEVIPLASNPDVSYQSNFPIIETASQNKSSAPYIYSHIYAGSIRIGNKIYTNGSSISCLYDESSPNIGQGFHDGSTKTGTSAPTGYIHPTYLYLIADGSGFNCIYSFNNAGPTGISARWLRAVTVVGMFSPSFGLPSTLKTEGGFTHVLGGVILELPVAASLTTYDARFIFTSTMKYVSVDRFVCLSGANASVYEKVYRPDTGTGVVSSTALRTHFCFQAIGIETSARAYRFGSGIIDYQAVSQIVSMNILGWAEKPLSSI